MTGEPDTQAKGDERLDMKATLKGNTLIVEIEINTPPQPSKSGKTKVVASTYGNTPTTVTVDGKPVIIGLNAYVRA